MSENKPEAYFSGILKRKGAFFGMWNSYFCEIKNRYFYVYKHQGSRTLDRKFEITHETIATPMIGEENRFEVETPGLPPFVFQADSEKTVMDWILAIKTTAVNCGTSISMDSFKIISVIGRGFYGKVMLVQKKGTNEFYAIKSIHKNRLIETNKVHTVFCERNIMMKVKHPFIVSLSFAFQTPTKFYLGMEYVPGGELFTYISKKKKLPISEVRFYLAEIGLALEHLHQLGVVYRDLKPENILLDVDGHIKITDFGLSKDLNIMDSTSTFCGTSEYLAPEIIRREPYSFPIDWWSLGCLCYEMLFGYTPFYDENKSRIFQKILHSQPDFPADTDQTVIDFILELLEKNPAERGTFENLKQHAFWDNFDFQACLDKKIQPIYVPIIDSLGSPDNFDSQFTMETPADSIATPATQSQFTGFSFTNLDSADQIGLPPIPSFESNE